MSTLVAPSHPSLIATLSVWVASEAVAKIARLGAIIIAARALTAAELGLVAMVLAIGEVLKALAENGVGQKIIAATSENLAATCNTAARLFRIWCGALFALGCLIAAGLHFVGNQTEAALLLVVFSGQFVFMPLGLVSCFLAMRNGKSRSVAMVAGGQIIFSAILSVILLTIWPTPAALILPRLLTASAWAYAMRRLAPWTPDETAGQAPLAPFVGFGGAVLGVEMTKALRLQADKLIIGGILGMEALGVWFFAVNAGLGLATSLANALALALFPRLCAATGTARRDNLYGGLRTALLVLSPIVLAQALLAPTYVPIIFGSEWVAMTDLVSVLCLAAIPAIIWSATAQWLRAENRAGTEFRLSLTATAILAVSLGVAAPFGLPVAAAAYLGTAVLTQGGAAFFILKTSR